MNPNEQARRAWESNADFWNQRMGESGTPYVRNFLLPTLEALLPPVAGKQILDLACGNGLYSRHFAALGADVLACDFSQSLLALAAQYPSQPKLSYQWADATDYHSLLALRPLNGAQKFDVIISTMALMDIADLRQLAKALPQLLSPNGCFVFSVMHPALNSPYVEFALESSTVAGRTHVTPSLRISGYLQEISQDGEALSGQPVPQPYFHRPLHALLAPFLQGGLVLTGLEEPTFHSLNPASNALGWSGPFSAFPPALFVRLGRN